MGPLQMSPCCHPLSHRPRVQQASSRTCTHTLESHAQLVTCEASGGRRGPAGQAMIACALRSAGLSSRTSGKERPLGSMPCSASQFFLCLGNGCAHAPIYARPTQPRFRLRRTRLRVIGFRVLGRSAPARRAQHGQAVLELQRALHRLQLLHALGRDLQGSGLRLG